MTLPCGQNIRISIGLADECVIPSGVLRGEVIVVVSSNCTAGIRYRRIRLELLGLEHNAVRDDQGEFDALLDSYTSDRTYLSRHVTLAGRRKASEDAETAMQRRQEVMFHEHHTSPYYRVVPVKPTEPTAPKCAKTAGDAPTGAPTPPAAATVAGVGGPDATTAAADAGTATATGARAAVAATFPSSPVPQKSHGDSEAAAALLDDGERHLSSPGHIGRVSAVEPTGNAGDSQDENADQEDDDGSDDQQELDADNDDGVHVQTVRVQPEDVKHPSSGNTTANSGKGLSVPTSGELRGESSSTPLRVEPPTVAAIEQLEGRDVLPFDEQKTGRRRSKQLRLMPGRYTFPFTFRVPPWMPPSLYYSIEDASGSITYTARAYVDIPGARDPVSQKRFYVLSAISRRQLLASHEEAVEAATSSPLPPLSALFQVFACNFLGNLCCLESNSAVEVEVALQCSRALVLADANATYQVFRNYHAAREDVVNDEMRAGVARMRRKEQLLLGSVGPTGAGRAAADANAGGNDTQKGSIAANPDRRTPQAFSGYDAFMERKYQAPEHDFTSPADFADRFLRAQHVESDGGGVDANGKPKASGFESLAVDGAVDGVNWSSSSAPDPAAALRAADRAARRRAAKQEALRERRAEVEKALPLPIGVLPVIVRVRNGCVKREISKVRVELRETIQIFKSLEMPRVFKHPLARYDYTVSIPPGNEVTFAARLQLPKQFRRRKEDDAKLCPPPGVKTANITTSTEIVVTFPGLSTYVEEEDWVNSVVQLAEAVDMTDEVLDLPTRYS